MVDSLETNEIGLLLLIQRLAAAGQPLGRSTLLELAPQFEAEGSLFLFKNRLAEYGGLDLFHRSLYIIQTKE